jgi:hypothetical protein
MTPRKLRPLRDLRRLQRNSESAKANVTTPTATSLNTSSNPTANQSPSTKIDHIKVRPRVIDDIQVLVEASHLSQAPQPRIAFVAALGSDNDLQTVIRVQTGKGKLENNIAEAQAELDRLGSPTKVVGFVDQIDGPERTSISALAKQLVDFNVGGLYLILSHASSTAGSSTLPEEPFNSSDHEISWSSWNESHKLSAFDSRLNHIDIRVILVL